MPEPSATPQPEAAPAPPARRRRGPPAIVVLALAFAIVLLSLGVSAWYTSLAVERAYKGWVGDDVFVQIPQGASVSSIGRRLREAGVIERPTMFRLAVWQLGVEKQLKAGEYRFTYPLSPRRVAETLASGAVYLRPITFLEGWSIDDMATLYEREQFGSGAEFLDAARDVSLIADLDPAAPDLEGYLFPDTYQLPRTMPARDLVKRMVGRFREVAEALAPSRTAGGASIREWVTLASLVEKETAKDDERPLVAAVYRNRVRLGMGLQCDPTVIYALKKAGQWTGNLTRANLQFDSPYNTYRYAGMPPGPIASPGLASLRAASAPADVPYLYFVSRNDGTHAFARTLAEHNDNVHRFQIEFFRQRRARTTAPQANGGH